VFLVLAACRELGAAHSALSWVNQQQKKKPEKASAAFLGAVTRELVVTQ